jgi:hypothetical protein
VIVDITWLVQEVVWRLPMTMEEPRKSSESRIRGGERSYSLAMLFGVVTISAIAFGAAVQLDSARGFALAVVLYVVILVASIRRIPGQH